MIKLKFKSRALSELKSFIRNYEEAFYELYRDTGIWSEDLIIQTYQESARKLYLQILQEIENKLDKKQVLGSKSLDLWQELNFYVGDRLVIVYYSQNLKNKVRLIESIAIDRKPIIF
ncbi:MAG: hypothetical protein WAN61_02360 [Minisyncoccia bacterium]